MTPFDVSEQATAVNMQSREALFESKDEASYSISFSPALHFLPEPNLDSHENVVFPAWSTLEREERVSQLRKKVTP